jgi:thiol-disulfide isomerase/thioredoxin
MKYLLVPGLLLALAGCNRSPEPAATQPAATPPHAAAPAAAEVQKSASVPTLTLPTVNGELYELAAHRGKWVVVNFWATWCGPCLKEMPELSALHTMRENVEVVGLAYEEIEPAEMQVFLKEHPVTYPIAIVDIYQPPQDFATPRGLPITYLIAPDGKLAKQFLGPVTAQKIEAEINAAEHGKG